MMVQAAQPAPLFCLWGADSLLECGAMAARRQERRDINQQSFEDALFYGYGIGITMAEVETADQYAVAVRRVLSAPAATHSLGRAAKLQQNCYDWEGLQTWKAWLLHVKRAQCGGWNTS
jgi:hypothetical protein